MKDSLNLMEFDERQAAQRRCLKRKHLIDYLIDTEVDSKKYKKNKRKIIKNYRKCMAQAQAIEEAHAEEERVAKMRKEIFSDQ